jgi:hypothetical protein
LLLKTNTCSAALNSTSLPWSCHLTTNLRMVLVDEGCWSRHHRDGVAECEYCSTCTTWHRRSRQMQQCVVGASELTSLLNTRAHVHVATHRGITR